MSPQTAKERTRPAPAEAKNAGDWKIEKYGRFWAVYNARDELICITVYKRGARELVKRLSSTTNLMQNS